MGSTTMADSNHNFIKTSATGTHPYNHTHLRQHQHQHHHSQSFPSPSSPPNPPNRIHTLDLKAKLATALGLQGKRYWDALLAFCTAKISRVEFETEARACLKSEDVHLHNSLVLGILYNASSAVPGPSAPRKGWSSSGSFATSHLDHHASLHLAEADAYQRKNADYEIEVIDSQSESTPIDPDKRLCILAASLTTAERHRIKAMSKPLARNMSSVANTSSWAGAGADLLERKRKEEEKKTKEHERKRLKELHTEIGRKDWMTDVLAEEAARQENRETLPNATAQALSRAAKVPLCIESKTLPQIDSLADIMTVSAVDAGLHSGVSIEAADMLSAGLQTHVRNVVSGMIMAVRANRAASGIRTSSASLLESVSGDAVLNGDRTSANTSIYASPTAATKLLLPDCPQDANSYSKFIRASAVRPSHQSSRNSTSSASTSTAASSIFTTGSAHRYNSHTGIGPDSSVTSLASTAATTLAGSGSDIGSDIEMDLDRDAIKARTERHNDQSDVSMRTEDSDYDGRDEDAVPALFKERKPEGHSTELGPAYRSDALPHRPSYRRSTQPAAYNAVRPSLSLHDLAFFLRLEPHVLVETAGLGALEKLLAPDADERPAPLHELQWTENSELGEEERLAVAARHSACSKEADLDEFKGDDGGLAPIYYRPIAPLPLPQGSRTNAPPTSSTGRRAYLVKQQAPLSLLLHRDNVLTKRKLAGQEENNVSQAKRSHPDPLSEVVDPVRLLAGYCW